MVVLIEFVVGVRDKALVRQFHVALIGVLLMDGMQTETFFHEVAAHREKGCAVWGKQVGGQKGTGTFCPCP